VSHFESDGGDVFDYFEEFDRKYHPISGHSGLDYDFDIVDGRITEWTVFLVAIIDGRVWQIARSEHEDGGMHDVTDEAVHIDIIDPRVTDSIKSPNKEYIGHYSTPSEGLNAAMQYLTTESERLVRRYERWQQ
jgi:hypothetical protein